MLKKRGMSEVIVVVLIIIFSVAAVGIIGEVIINSVKNSQTTAANTVACSKISFEVLSCTETSAIIKRISTRGYNLADVNIINQEGVKLTANIKDTLPIDGSQAVQVWFATYPVTESVYAESSYDEGFTCASKATKCNSILPGMNRPPVITITNPSTTSVTYTTSTDIYLSFTIAEPENDALVEFNGWFRGYEDFGAFPALDSGSYVRSGNVYTFNFAYLGNGQDLIDYLGSNDLVYYIKAVDSQGNIGYSPDINMRIQ